MDDRWQQLLALVARAAGVAPERVNERSTLSECGLDSLSLLEILVGYEDTMNAALDMTVIADAMPLLTVADLYQFVLAGMRAPTGTTN